MGLIATETDSKGNTTAYEYNRNGWLTKTTNPDGSYVETTYSITGGNNNKVTTSYNGQYFTVDYYDNMGRIKYHKEKTESGAEKNLNSYNYSKNRLISVFDGNNSSEKYTYDSFNRVITVKNYNKDNKTLISTQSVDYNDYDLSKTVNVGGKTKSLYYDVAGRLTKEEHNSDAGLNTVLYEYDYMGNVVKTTDANGGTVTNTYNDIGQLLSVTDQLNQTTSYEYDSYGNVSKTTHNNGSVYLYEYDNIGRLQKTTDPLGISEYYVYDKVGNMIAYKDKKEQVTNSLYDNMNRMLSKQTGDLNVSYTYDNFGNVLTMNDTTGTTSYAYQYNNLLSGITTPDNKTISYSYDIVGNIASVTDYAGNVYSYTYDGLNRIDTIINDDTVVADYDYTNFGTIDKVTYPEGSSQYTYDNALRVISQTNTLTSGNVINQYSYGYDPAGNQIYKIDSSGGTEKVTSYDYDAVNRLIFVTEPDNTITSYTYDSGNNIMTKDITHPESYEFTFKQNGSEHTISGISTHNFTYSYNALNQLMQETEHVAGSGNTYSGYLEIVSNYTYDGNGNTISAEKAGQIDESVVQYSYNEWNQLVQYTDTDNNVTNYGYDGTGMRVSKTQGDTIQKYYWDRGYISNEAEGSNFYAANYIGVQGVFARENQGSTDYLFKNSHGDVTALVNSGEIVRTYDYDAYGTQKNINPSDTNPFRYCGEYFDDESGNIYLRNRYYDPSNGRFITEDPIRDGLNWYAYCANNPVNRVDPLGLENVVVAGGAYHVDQGKYQFEFVDSALLQISNLNDATLLVANAGWTQSQYNAITQAARERSINLLWFSSIDSLTNYINNGRDRNVDPITSFYVFAHGTDDNTGQYAITLGLYTNKNEQLKWYTSDISKINRNAFVGNSTSVFYSCRTGNNFDNGNFAKTWAWLTGNITYAYSGLNGRSEYSDILGTWYERHIKTEDWKIWDKTRGDRATKPSEAFRMPRADSLTQMKQFLPLMFSEI